MPGRMTPTVRFDESGLPQAPADIADEVELYARESGRHATLHFIPTLLMGRTVIRGTWMARFTLKPDDPRLSVFQDGQAEEEPTDPVWFHVPNENEGAIIPGTFDQHKEGTYRALDIVAMGASGVRAFLERGNMLSGRGEFDSLEEQVTKVREHNREVKTKLRAHHKEENRHELAERRRSWLKIPVVPVNPGRPAAIATTEKVS